MQVFLKSLPSTLKPFTRILKPIKSNIAFYHFDFWNDITDFLKIGLVLSLFLSSVQKVWQHVYPNVGAWVWQIECGNFILHINIIRNMMRRYLALNENSLLLALDFNFIFWGKFLHDNLNLKIWQIWAISQIK